MKLSTLGDASLDVTMGAEMVWMMEGRLLSVAIMGEASGRLSDCATCGKQGGKFDYLKSPVELNQACHMHIHNFVFFFF